MKRIIFTLSLLFCIIINVQSKSLFKFRCYSEEKPDFPLTLTINTEQKRITLTYEYMNNNAFVEMYYKQAYHYKGNTIFLKSTHYIKDNTPLEDLLTKYGDNVLIGSKSMICCIENPKNKDKVSYYALRSKDSESHLREYAELLANLLGIENKSNSSGSTGSGSSRSISEIELPLKLEAGPGLKMKLTSASEGFYSAVVPHKDWEGKATDYVVTVSTQTGKYLDDTSLEEFTLEKEGVFDVDPSWVSVRHNSTRALLLRVSPLYSSSSRYARIHIKVNGKEAGQIFLIQKAEGAEVE